MKYIQPTATATPIAMIQPKITASSSRCCHTCCSTEVNASFKEKAAKPNPLRTSRSRQTERCRPESDWSMETRQETDAKGFVKADPRQPELPPPAKELAVPPIAACSPETKVS